MLRAGESQWSEMLSNEWSEMPWRIWNPPSQIWEQMPTFLLAEWGFRLSTLVALYHAVSTGRKKSWCAAWICGTANDIFFMFMPFCDNFWQAQASIMITPRLPLYIVEMYASVMYYGPVAASLLSRRMGLNPVAQACITGLLCHFFYGVYDINGPRYLWWTWHDGDPAISQRNYNAPYGSSIWILTYCSLQAFLNSWILRAKGARLTGTVAPSCHEVSATCAVHSILGVLPVSVLDSGRRPKGWLLSAAAHADRVQVWLGSGSDAMQILFRAVVCTPLFMVLMGQMSLFSMDKLGIPGIRTYTLTLLLMLAIILQQLWAGRLRPPAPALPASYKKANRALIAALGLHFVLHTLINVCGDPLRHSSTGIHQRIVEPQGRVFDIMGWERVEDLPITGPHIHSKHDYSFRPALGAKLAGQVYEPRATGLQSSWYTVYGKEHKDRQGELMMGTGMAILGMVAFVTCLWHDI